MSGSVIVVDQGHRVARTFVVADSSPFLVALVWLDASRTFGFSPTIAFVVPVVPANTTATIVSCI